MRSVMKDSDSFYVQYTHHNRDTLSKLKWMNDLYARVSKIAVNCMLYIMVEPVYNITSGR